MVSDQAAGHQETLVAALSSSSTSSLACDQQRRLLAADQKQTGRQRWQPRLAARRAKGGAKETRWLAGMVRRPLRRAQARQ